MIRTLIVDDEPLARRKIRKFLEAEEEFEVIAECGDGREAIFAIEDTKPDLVFLDVQMPEQDGFSVIEAIGPDRMPATVFVTAYDRYAIKAFNFHAVDYLLKPFDRSRFRQAVGQIVEQVERVDSKELNRQLLSLLEDLKSEDQFSDRLAVKEAGGVVFVKVEEIDWIDAAGNYVRLNTRSGEAHLLRDTMSAIESRLDPQIFARVHRSTIVNLERIREIRPQAHGEHLIILDGSQRLTLSRSYKDKLQSLIS